jgi:hypothetical protein
MIKVMSASAMSLRATEDGSAVPVSQILLTSCMTLATTVTARPLLLSSHRTRQLYLIERLRAPVHSVRTAVVKTTIKETPCVYTLQSETFFTVT